MEFVYSTYIAIDKFYDCSTVFNREYYLDYRPVSIALRDKCADCKVANRWIVRLSGRRWRNSTGYVVELEKHRWLLLLIEIKWSSQDIDNKSSTFQVLTSPPLSPLSPLIYRISRRSTEFRFHKFFLIRMMNPHCRFFESQI